MKFPPVVWGKYSAPDTWLSLVDHMSDVAACFEALIELPLFRDRLAKAVGREPDQVTRERLCVLAFLHDIGKLSSAFQAKALNPAIRAGHSAQGWQLFTNTDKSVVQALNLQENVRGWGPGTDGLLLAALAHHGRPIDGREEPRASDWAARDGYDPVRAAAEVGAACRSRYPLAFSSGADARVGIPDRAELQHFFAGLVALADQVGSRTEDFPLDREAESSRAPEALLKKLLLDVGNLRAGAQDLPPWQLFGWRETEAPRPIQQALAELPLDIRLAVLESETGSGKTEAAFLRFHRLFSAGLVDGMYFAVPTRAAASQIHGRIDRAARASFGAECVLALPGYLKVGDATGRALPGWRVEWADDPDQAGREARWSAETPRRFLAAPVAVGTVDQVMLAGLQVKWAHFRAATLSRSYLVVDEIHASDGYMSVVLQRVIRDHVALGGHALLMSATLGAVVRAQLLHGRRAPPDRHPDYPALSWIARGKETHAAPSAPERQKVLQVTSVPLIHDPDAIARLGLEAARQGAQVLVIRNTVDQVVAVQRAVEALDPDAPLLEVNGRRCPHHGRYAAEDRILLDSAVEEAMGKAAPAASRIVCGSQTLEQSLDIDADFLITDLCPIDVLLQRMGRLHRHLRSERPVSFADPRCLVLLPERVAPDMGLLRFGLGPNRDGGGVYPDITGLEAVCRLIGTGATWTIPRDNRALVEAGTDPGTLDRRAEELGEAWTAARNKLIGAEIASGQFARQNLIDRSRCFDGTLEDCFPREAKILTRIGADRLEVPFADGTTGPFGGAISRIGVPGHWRVEGLAEAIGTEWRQSAPGELTFAGTGLVYDRFGLRLERRGR